MFSTEIDEIYEELLRIYEVKYPYNPKRVLSYRITELKREGRSREEAILKLYRNEGRITQTEAEELGKTIKRSKIGAIEEKIKEHEKNVEKLTLLFSKGELNELSYKAAKKPLEEIIAKLQEEKKDEEGKSLEERLAASNREAAAIGHRSESVELATPSPTTALERLGLRTISKYFAHGFTFSIVMIALVFVSVAISVFLIAIGSFIGLMLGFLVLFFLMGGLNSFLTENIWSVSTKTDWMNLLIHGFVLSIALIVTHIPGAVANLIVPNIATTVLLIIIQSFIDGFIAKRVAGWWEKY